MSNPLEQIMEEFNAEFELAKTQIEQDAVAEKYDVLIESAESELELEFDGEIETLDLDIQAEIEKAEQLIKEDEDRVEKNLKEMLDNPDPKGYQAPKESSKSEKLEIQIDAAIDKYTVKELKKIAKDNGLSGYSKLKELELINLLMESGVSL